MYDYHELELSGNPAVIFRGIVGSRAYGTANTQSDTDIRGIFVVPSREYVRLSVPPKQVSDERNDRTYYSLLRFCELMSEANPTTLEMLYLPKDCILKTTVAFGVLEKSRDVFISQMAVDSHLGYAVSQIKKARGCNKRVWNPWPEEPPEPEDYCAFLADVRQFPRPLKETGVDLGRCRVTRLSKSVTADIFHVYDFGEETGGVFRGGAPVVSSVSKEDAGKRIGVLIFNKQAFDSAKRQHQEYWNWRPARSTRRMRPITTPRSSGMRWKPLMRTERSASRSSAMLCVRMRQSRGFVNMRRCRPPSSANCWRALTSLKQHAGKSTTCSY